MSIFSSDEKHRATIAILREALDYLKLLPRTHATNAIARKIQAHLDEPTQNLVAQTFTEWEGEFWKYPEGLPLLLATFGNSKLSLSIHPSIPTDASRGLLSRAESAELVKDELLADRVTLMLNSRDQIPR